jgi:sugar phosphate isomerase/epimerase
VKGICDEQGVSITELSVHLQSQLVAVHPAYDTGFDAFAAPAVRGNPKERQKWAVDQTKKAAKASANLGLKTVVGFTGALAFPYLYPWPPRSPGMIDMAFEELGKRWKPILDVYDKNGVDMAYELHPGEDTFDGVTFEMFLERVGNHPRANILYDPSHFVLQQLDYVEFIHIYHERIRMFHVKDAEFRPTGRAGVYGGYADWADRPGRFRSLGDGQVDFSQIFSAFTRHDYRGWAVLEWECCFKHPEQGAAEGAPFIAAHMIRKADRAFDDFAGAAPDAAKNRRVLGLS